MKLLKRKILTAAATGVVAAWAASVSAQFFSITVDENGNMTLNGGLGAAGAITVEPISGMATLSYPLPFPGNAGDIQLFATNEPPASHQVSDLIRFPGNGRLYFFSLQDDASAPDLADVPALPPPITPNVTIPETGPEGNNAGNWSPGPGGIGGDPNNPSLTYVFVSDIPEPGAWLLTGLAGGLVLILRWRRKGLRM